MKKTLIFTVIAILVLFSSCYDENHNTTLHINLENIPYATNVRTKTMLDNIFSFFSKEAYAQTIPGDVLSINIAILDGDSKILSGKYPASESVIELSVSPGKNLTVIVGAEGADYENAGYPNIILYYGSAIADVEANIENEVTILMSNMNDSFNLAYDFGNDIINWNKIEGTGKYELWYASFTSSCLPADYSKTGESLTNSYDLGGYTQGCFRVRSYFSIFNLYSEYSDSISP